ncbi:hypothetical protein KR222_001720 [Zaprionus bogoriensis]|nr:hypothetical protein KR222_001720 [Zaprionus bogoriensis]
MVVLEGGGGVVTIGNNQYLQPDYLAPLPTTMDAKKSPLALLAQTCSQIGADSSAVKPLLAMDKNKNKSGTCSTSSSASSSSCSGSADISASKSPSQAKSPKASASPITTTTTAAAGTAAATTTTTGSEVKLAFKPYETNVLSQQNQNSFRSSASLSEEPQQQRPSSKSSSSGQERVPSRSKSNATPTDAAQLKELDSSRKTVSPAGSSQRGASPIVRSGMEVLSNANGTAQHPKEMSSMAAAAAAAAAAYKAAGAGPYGLNPLSALCCPPGMEQHAANPAFRPPFAGGFSHHHAAMLAAAAANGGGYPGAPGAPGGPAGAGAQPNPYISYQRIKTPAGGEAIVPVCKDPYCPGCPYSAHTQQMLMGAPCPAGCTQCEHQKYGMAMAAGLPPAHPYSQAAAAAAAANAAAARSAPYVCSWVVGDAYCGKRFQTSDELFTHLRTHTGNLSDPAAAAAALAQSQAQSLLGTLFPPSALRGGYPTPPLSPMSAAAAAARYHPYGKPVPGALAGGPSPFGAAGAFNPAAAAAAAALGPYYSPYAMYGQRMGAAHQ